jgi:hypothetical protein
MPTNSPKREAQILKRDRIRIELEEYILEEKKIRQKKGCGRVVENGHSLSVAIRPRSGGSKGSSSRARTVCVRLLKCEKLDLSS